MLLKWSKNPDGTPRAKARLIVRGFMDPDAWAGTVPTSSPTTTRLSRSVLLSLAANMHWPVCTSDIATAFLQGKPQSRKLWVQLPAECLQLLGATADTRMLLLKPCYGQIDAPRAWYMAAVDKLLNMGLRQHPQDPCCFLAYEADLNPEHRVEQESSHLFGPYGLCGIIIIMHVDDMLGCGSEASKCYQDLIIKLKATFNFREWKTGLDGSDLSYCGCDLKITPEGGYKLEQNTYMKKVKPINVDKRRNVNEVITEGEVSQLRALLGSLQWPAVQSSPHLQGSTSILSGHVARATVQTLLDCNKLLKFSKENADVGLVYNNIGDVQDLRLDASLMLPLPPGQMAVHKSATSSCWSRSPCWNRGGQKEHTTSSTGEAKRPRGPPARHWALKLKEEDKPLMRLNMCASTGAACVIPARS